MSFNSSTIDLEVLFDTIAKAEQFIKIFAEGYRQDLSSFPSSFTNARFVNSSDPRKQYLGLREIYQRVIIPNFLAQMRSKLEKENPGLSVHKVNLLFDKEKEKNIEFLRKNLEDTRIGGAYQVIKTGVPESNLPSGFGLGKATCGTCGKEKGDKEKGWKLGEWKEKGIPKTYFCSQSCYDKFDWKKNNPDSGRKPPKTKNCFFCRQQYQGGVYFEENPGMVFCSKRCARSWEEEVWGKKNLADQRNDFITKSLEELSGWNLLTDEEKENFIRQVNSSEPKQFKNIFQQAKKLVGEKRKSGEDQTSGEGEESGENNSSDKHDNSDTVISESNTLDNDSDNIPNQEEKNNNNELSEDISLANLPLVQSQAKAEQEVERVIKDNSFSKKEEEELKKEICSGENWKDYLKKLDTSAKVAEFINKVKMFALKKKLSIQTSTQDKSPENGWVLPVIISVLSILALTTLILIIRKRKQKGF